MHHHVRQLFEVEFVRPSMVIVIITLPMWCLTLCRISLCLAEQA